MENQEAPFKKYYRRKQVKRGPNPSTVKKMSPEQKKEKEENERIFQIGWNALTKGK